MIEITGEVIIEVQCDKCGKTGIDKHLIESVETIIHIPLPEGWITYLNREHQKRIVCPDCKQA